MEDPSTKIQQKFAITTCCLIALTTIIVGSVSQINVVWSSLWPVGITCGLLVLLRIRCRRKGPTNVVAMLSGITVLIVFFSLFAISRYLTVELSSSTYDTELSVIDRLSIEAPPIVLFTRSFPTFDQFLFVVYNALYVHLALFVLYGTGLRQDNFRTFLTINRLQVAAFAGLLLFAIFPAYNTTFFYQLVDPYNNLRIVEHLKHIRSDEFTNLRYVDALGIIPFRPFHVTLHFVLLIDIFENEKRFSRMLFIPWTVLMCWSAITVGSHYIADLAIGISIAAVSYFLLKCFAYFSNAKNPLQKEQSG